MVHGFLGINQHFISKKKMQMVVHKFCQVILPQFFSNVWREEVALAIGNQKKAHEKANKVVEKQSLIKTRIQSI
jgi:hypothetical protein